VFVAYGLRCGIKLCPRQYPLAINTVEREWYIDGPVSDGVPIPSVQVVIQPVLTFFKPITAPASVDGYMNGGTSRRIHCRARRNVTEVGPLGEVPLRSAAGRW